MHRRWAIPSRVVASTIVVSLVVYLSLSSSFRSFGAAIPALQTFAPSLKHRVKLPDFSQYVHLRTVSAEELALDDPSKRLIIVGDIHGMEKALDQLLHKLSYDVQNDRLIFVGDVISKGPSSSSVLSRFAAQNITGVRGNHEQEVIEWRGWIEWVESRKGGRKWLRHRERGEFETSLTDSLGFNRAKFPMPKGLEFGDEHYQLARQLSAEEYRYLRSLPLTIHLPSLHAYIVHAGILPFDPTHSPHSHRQPLSHHPKVHKPKASNDKSLEHPTDIYGVNRLRTAQELALLNEIPQNQEAWVLLNMRSVDSDGKIYRKTKYGRPWTKLWNPIMDHCGGFDTASPSEINTDYLRDNIFTFTTTLKLPCRPITVVYGHAAKRGLDINRWSMGLDSGCVYGRLLSAMVLGPGSVGGQTIAFGEKGKARIISVGC